MTDLSTLRENPDLVRLNPEVFSAPETGDKKATRGKYRNVRTVYKGREYASKREAKRAQELDELELAFEVVAWFPQVPFRLAGGIKYVCDFLVVLPNGTWRAEDVKSPATRKIGTYRLKRKLFKDRFGFEIVEV